MFVPLQRQKILKRYKTAGIIDVQPFLYPHISKQSRATGSEGRVSSNARKV